MIELSLRLVKWLADVTAVNQNEVLKDLHVGGIHGIHVCSCTNSSKELTYYISL